MSKEPLIVFLGAGASIHAGLPTTQQITDWIRNNKLSGTLLNNVIMDNSTFSNNSLTLRTTPDRPIFETIYRALQMNISQPNYEHVLAVLERLEELFKNDLMLYMTRKGY